MSDELTPCPSCLPNPRVMAQYQILAHINFFMVNILRFITRKQLELSLCLMSPEPPPLKRYKNGKMIWTIKLCYPMELLFQLYSQQIRFVFRSHDFVYNHMTFFGHIVYLWPEQHHLRPSRARVQMMLQGAQKNYLPNKSHVIIIIINTQGQIVQIGENVFHQERLCNMKSCCGQQIPFTARTFPFGAFQRGQFVIWPCVVIINSY